MYVANLDKQVYAPGETITVTGSAYNYTECGNSHVSGWLSSALYPLTVTGMSDSVISTTLVNRRGRVSPWLSFQRIDGSRTYTAPNVPGTYTFSIKGEWLYYDGGNGHGYSHLNFQVVPIAIPPTPTNLSASTTVACYSTPGINVRWSPSAGATSYTLRDGENII
jgi:hypothetical protein